MPIPTLVRKKQHKLDSQDAEITRLKARITGLETQITQLLQERGVSPTWWKDQAGRFENDAVFEEIIRLGRELRNRPLVKRKRAAARH